MPFALKFWCIEPKALQGASKPYVIIIFNQDKGFQLSFRIGHFQQKPTTFCNSDSLRTVLDLCSLLVNPLARPVEYPADPGSDLCTRGTIFSFSILGSHFVIRLCTDAMVSFLAYLSCCVPVTTVASLPLYIPNSRNNSGVHVLLKLKYSQQHWKQGNYRKTDTKWKQTCKYSIMQIQATSSNSLLHL